jgi:hypothetical protein
VIVFDPTTNATGPDAAPELTDAPSTVTVAVASLTVDVTVTLAVALLTDAAYATVPTANTGLNVPDDSVNPDNDETGDPKRVTVTV